MKNPFRAPTYPERLLTLIKDQTDELLSAKLDEIRASARITVAQRKLDILIHESELLTNVPHPIPGD